jgi:uncharacterized protein (TIGR03067 family)
MACVVGIGMLASAPAGDTAQEDLKKLQGSWVIKMATHKGKPLDKEIGNDVTISGNKYTIKQKDGKVATGVFKIDAGKSPKTIDFTADPGQGQSLFNKAIYDFQAGLLRVSVGVEENRPTEFDDKAFPVLLLERKKV